MAKWQKGDKLGLKTSRSPGSITNAQHHDQSLSERDISGSPGTIGRIISNAATSQVVADYAVLRVANTTATTQYLFIGEVGDVPGAAPDITNGMAIPPNFYENIYLGRLKSCESIYIKASDNGVQVTEFEL